MAGWSVPTLLHCLTKNLSVSVCDSMNAIVLDNQRQ